MNNLKGAISGMTLGIIAIVAIAGIALYLNPGLLSGTQQVTGGSPPGSGSGSQEFATNIRLGLVNAISTATANGNCELVDSNYRTVIAATNVNGVTSMTSTGASDFNGFAVCGNDNFALGWKSGWTDRGAEFYISTFPISFSGRAGDITYSDLRVWPESTPTWTGIDDGTVEATTNITVGSGATVDTTEIRIAVATANEALGNPDFNGQGPLALCANTTASGNGIWNSVRPLSHDGTIPIPAVLSNRTVLNGECYKLSTNALVDSQSGGFSSTYKFGLRLQARTGQNPGADQGGTPDHVALFLLNKCWVITDQNVWKADYNYESNSVTDQQCGLDSVNNIKSVFAN